MKQFYQTLILFFFIGLLGCAHPISPTLRKDLDPTLTFEQITENPEKFIGKKILLGGTIVETRVLNVGTEIEVVQKKINSSGYPEASDQSGGRFIFVKKSFLEPEIYSKGRGITGVGKIKGTTMGKVGERPYKFPVIEAEDLVLREDIERKPYFYPPYWDPWFTPNQYRPYWPYSPYWPYY